MNSANWFGPETTVALSLTLLHSLWQVGLAVVLLWCCERLFRRFSIERNYALHVGTLLLTLALLPVTFWWVQPKVELTAVAPIMTEPTSQPTATPPILLTTEMGPLPVMNDTAGTAAEVATPIAPPIEHVATRSGTDWWPVAAMWVAALYVLGVLVMLSRLGLSIRRTERIRRRASRLEGGPLAEVFARLARKLGVGLGCVLATSRDVLVPTVVGVVKPTILLPVSALTGLTTSELEMILLHELAHVRRHDQWVNLVQRLAEVVLFFNPALWYLSRRIATLREYCCDELTCRQMLAEGEGPRLQYAATLLHVVELAHPARALPAELTALAASGRGPSELRRRVARLFGEPLAEPVRLSRSQGVLLVALAVVLIAAPFAQSKSEAESDTPTSEVATVDANERVAEARRRTFGLQKTPKIAIHQRMWNGTIPTMSNVSGDPAELLWRARGQEVEGRMRDETSTQTTLAWDGQKLLIESGSRLSGENPWTQSRYWNGETGWLGEGSPTDRRHYRYGTTASLMDRLSLSYFPHWHAAGGRLPWDGPELVLEENEIAPSATNYQLIGTETIDGTECEIFIGPKRSETLWIDRENGFIKAIARHYHLKTPDNFYTDQVRKVAGRSFKDSAEYGDWYLAQPPDLQEKLAAHWNACAWPEGEPGNLAVFSDYREIAPGVHWPMRCERIVTHFADRKKGTRRFYRSEIRVENVETDFSIHELAKFALPQAGSTVTDRRADQVVEYEWAPKLSESEIETKRLKLEKTRDAKKADQQKIDETPINSVEDAITILLEGPDVNPNRVWVRAIKYLVDRKEEAFPVVLKAFDAETRDHPMSKLAFTLRAMDDPRAVPALIRAIPRTLLRSRSDFGLIIDGDSELVQFVQQHDLGTSSGLYFDYDRAFREVVGALHKLTDKEFGEMQLNFVYLGETPTQRNAARRQFHAAASRWAEWWDAEGHNLLVSDAAYAKVTLPNLVLEEVTSPGLPTLPVGEQLELVETSSGVSISSIHETDSHAFYDLDTGRESGWPAHLPKFGKIGLDAPELLAWAREEGFDLVGVNYTPEGEDKPLYCLKPLDLKAWKLSEQEHRQLQDSITGKSPYPLTNAVDLLVPRRVIPKPYDNKFSGDAFLFLTREGTSGVLRATEQVTDTNVQGGGYSIDDSFDGVGFYRGVEFSLQVIAPVAEDGEKNVPAPLKSADGSEERPTMVLLETELVAPQAPAGETSPAASPAPDQPRIAALQELVDSYTNVYTRLKARYEQGTGTYDTLQQSRLVLEAAKGDLAQAQGDLVRAIECYERAVAAADEAAVAIERAEDQGLVTIDVLLDAHRRKAEVKTTLNRLKEELTDKPKVEGNTEPQSSTEPAAASEGPTLFGRITDTEGKPVANVTVTCRGLAPLHFPNASITTDEDGKYQFSGLKGRELAEGDRTAAKFYLELEHPTLVCTDGKRLRRVELPLDTPHREQMDFAMTLGGKIAGTIVDPESGKPAPNLQLRIHRYDDLYKVFTEYTRTDAQGSFQTPPLYPAEYRIDITTADSRRIFPATESVAVAPGKVTEVRRTMEGKHAATVPIHCLDSDNKPVAGAEVYVFQHEGGDDGKYRQIGPFTTDAAGRATCGEALFYSGEGYYDRWFYARVPGKLVGVARSSNWNGSGHYNPVGEVGLVPSRSIEGRVTVPDGYSPTSVTVAINSFALVHGGGGNSFPRYGAFSGVDTALPAIFECHPASDGSFQLHDVPRDGSVNLRGTADGLGEAQWHTRDANFKGIQLNFSKEGTLKGSVTNRGGEPMANVEITAKIQGSVGQRVGYLTTFRTTTDQQGHYELRGLPEWDLSISVTDPQNNLVFPPTAPFFIAPGREMNRDLLMELPIEVKGRVVDPESKPVAAATVFARAADGNEAIVAGAVSDSEGDFILRMPTGEFKIFFSELPKGFKYPKPTLLKQLRITLGQQAIEGLEFVAPRETDTEEAKDQPKDEGSQLLRDLQSNSQPLLDVMAQVHGYKPAEGKVLARVAPPFDVIRMEYYRAGHSSQADLIEEGPTAMTFRWEDGNLKNWGMSFGDREDPGYTLTGVLDALLQLKPQHIAGPKSLLNKPLAGDWVMETFADRKQVVAELEEILRSDFDMDVKLEFRNQERDVYVATGQYQFQPLEGQPAEDITQLIDRRSSADPIQIFGKELAPDSGAGGGSGEFNEFLDWVGRWIDAPVVNELDVPTQRQVSWDLHERNPSTAESRREDHDAELVLANITRQTGIEFKKAKRSVEVLVVEDAE